MTRVIRWEAIETMQYVAKITRGCQRTSPWGYILGRLRIHTNKGEGKILIRVVFVANQVNDIYRRCSSPPVLLWTSPFESSKYVKDVQWYTRWSFFLLFALSDERWRARLPDPVRYPIHGPHRILAVCKLLLVRKVSQCVCKTTLPRLWRFQWAVWHS